MNICPKCGVENSQESEPCPSCGFAPGKAARLQEQARERQLSELSAKVLGWEDDHPADGGAYDLSQGESRHRKSSYPGARLLSGLLYVLAVLIGIATCVSALWTWNLLVHVNSLFTWPVPATELAGATDIFTPRDMLFLVVLEVIGGLVVAGVLAAIATGLNLGRAMALDAYFTREYLARRLAGTVDSRPATTPVEARRTRG